jgi:hypothetical protein
MSDRWYNSNVLLKLLIGLRLTISIHLTLDFKGEMEILFEKIKRRERCSYFFIWNEDKKLELLESFMFFTFL